MKPESAPVTHEDIRRALRQFELAGGRVVRIPAQPAPHGAAIPVHTGHRAGWGVVLPGAPAQDATALTRH